MRTGYLITARLKSTRLPRKLLLDLAGKPLIGRMIERLRGCRRVDQIVVCTSDRSDDDDLANAAREEGVGVFRGSPDDVLARLAGAIEAYDLDYALNITGDCPLVDPGYADAIVSAYESTDADLVCAFDLPHGAFSYGLKPEALRQVLEIKDSEETEVWGPYFTDTGLFRVHHLQVPDQHRRPEVRLTVDYPEDLELVRALFERLHREGPLFSLTAILEQLDADPELTSLNRSCGARYARRWRRQSEIRLKPRLGAARGLVVGCGSIGVRHLRNLRRLGVQHLAAVRTRRGARGDLDPSLGVAELGSEREARDWRPDFAVISNPTSLHVETAESFLDGVRGLFLEKPLSHSVEGLDAFLNRVAESGVCTFVGYNLQFHPGVLAIETLLERDELGEPLILQAQVGQWLPDWHPAEDWRRSYVARPELGGGAVLSLIHEIRLALELLGPATRVQASFPGSPRLDLEVDSIADLQVDHAMGAVSQIHMDLLQRPVHRSGVLSCARGRIRYDLVANRVEWQGQEGGPPATAWHDAAFDANAPYVSEMATFLRYVGEGRVRHRHDVFHAAHDLAVVDAARRAASSGASVVRSSGGPP